MYTHIHVQFPLFPKVICWQQICFIWKALNFASVFETGFHVPRLALTPNPPSCLQRSSAGITGAHHYCLTFEIYIYYIKNSRSILFSLKFLQFISYLYDRAKVPPSSCLIWSHLWFSLKLILPPPPLLYSHHKESCGKVSNLALETQGWKAPANWIFLASAKLLVCFSPATANHDVIFLCPLLKAILWELFLPRQYRSA